MALQAHAMLLQTTLIKAPPPPPPKPSPWRPAKTQTDRPKLQSPPLQRRPQPKIQPPDEPNASGSKATVADVLRLLDSLQLPVDADTYDSLLKECISSKDAVQGAAVHVHIGKPKANKSGSSTRRLVNLANRVLLMYAACDRPDIARKLFDQMSKRNAGSWATVISAAADGGGHREALGLFVDMVCAQSFAVEPTDTLVLVVGVVIGSCVDAGETELGKQIHGLAVKMAVDSKLVTPLLRFYAAFGLLESARKLFDVMVPSSCNEATKACTLLACAYCREGRFWEGFHVFGSMFNATRLPNDEKKRKDVSVAFARMLSACARMEVGKVRIGCGRQLHARAVKIGLDCDLYVGTSLVNMYGRFGLPEEAKRVFEVVCRSSDETKDAVCWNAMVRSYLRNGCCAEAIKLLYEMRSAGIEPLESIVSQVKIASGS